MNKLNSIKRCLFALIVCLSVSLYGCESKNQTEKTRDTSSSETQQSEEVSSKEVTIDYGDEKSFEAALNEGKNLEGKVVRFVAGELNPSSKFGYNVMSGEHLNFVSSRNPDIKENDTVTVKVTTIENIMGSWIINYEKVDNAVEDDDTIIYSEPEETTAATTTTTEITTEQPQTTTKTTTDTPDEPAEKKSSNSYEHNEYYDIVKTESYKDSIGYTIMVHKVLAKKNAAVSSTILAYGNDGSVIGKSSDEITLTKGQYNFFYYYFEGDISKAKIQASFNAGTDSLSNEERNAVQMVKYNKSGDNLYITFKQNVDELDNLAKFRLLFYKNNKIVNTEDEYFNVYVENLNGKGSTDVAELWVYDIDFDRIEYFYEP